MIRQHTAADDHRKFKERPDSRRRGTHRRDRVYGMHGGAKAALVGFVLAMSGDCESSTIEGLPSTVTFQPRPVGQSGACSSPSRVMCSTVNARRPPMIAG
jgi:hypothetical protein